MEQLEYNRIRLYTEYLKNSRILKITYIIEFRHSAFWEI